MDQDKEIAVMSTIAKALDQFGKDESEIVKRILRWANSRYGVDIIGNLNNYTDYSHNEEGGLRGQVFRDIADLFNAASPKMEHEKALVAGFWLMTGEKKNEFTGWEANKNLKNLGHGIGNITDALTSLMRRKPSLVMQTAKGGTSRQARKKYKLTSAGLDHVRRMLRKEGRGSV